ncbi:MAK10-like protein [Tanacetum coccineum]
MENKNPIRTLGDYSRPSHEGYRNTIELPDGNNVVPLRSDTIRLVQNGCSFHGLWSEDPNKHLKDFLKLVDSLNLDIKEEKGIEGSEVAKGSIIELNELEALEPIESPDKEEEIGEGTNGRSIESKKEELRGVETKAEALVKTPSRLTDKEPVGTDIRLSLASHSYIYPLGIAEDVLIDIAGYVYLINFMILDINEDRKKRFILRTPFLTTTKAVIRFEKVTITLKSGKNKIHFVKVPALPSELEKNVEDDLDPITPTNTVSKLILEWGEESNTTKRKRWSSTNGEVRCLTIRVLFQKMKDVK